jgi:predicted RND superfamily exporter protein
MEVGIIKNTIRNLLIFVVISALIVILVFTITTYLKSKETQAFYTNTYTEAFKQTEATSDFIEAILENKDNITSQEVLSYLNDIHNSLDMTAKDFELISPRFLSDKSNTDNSFMRDLIQLYSDETTRLQNELLKNNSQDDFDDTKNILFIRLALMKSDLQKIIAINTPQLAKYTFDQIRQPWIDLVNSPEYREVTKVYKLNHPTLFVKGFIFPFKR